MSKRITTEEFIRRCNAYWSGEYDFTNTIYTNTKTKVSVRCIKHNHMFTKWPSDLLRGYGCPKCSSERQSKNTVKTVDWFINKARIIHGNKYDYTKSVYINSKTKLIITCKIHNHDFIMEPNTHLQGVGCRLCANEYTASIHRKGINDVMIESNKTHGNFYDYSKFKYIGMKYKATIICPIHGQFQQTPESHIRQAAGCPKCVRSRGERVIGNILDELNIQYDVEYKFSDCINMNPLPFDFYIKDKDILIEYQGEQHYKMNVFFGGSDGFAKRQQNDNIKKEYAHNNGHTLLIIPYWEFNNIELLLSDIIGTK